MISMFEHLLQSTYQRDMPQTQTAILRAMKAYEGDHSPTPRHGPHRPAHPA